MGALFTIYLFKSCIILNGFLFLYRWFHPSVKNAQAEEILKKTGVDGSFLVRPSESTLGDFTISVK